MDITTLAIILGAVIPVLVDLLKRFLKIEDPTYQKIVVGVICLIGALVLEFANGNIVAWQDIVTRFGIIIATSQAVYGLIYKDTLSGIVKGA